MDIKDFRGLMEAYSEVYAPQEELDEGYKLFPHDKVQAKAAKLKSSSQKNEPIKGKSDKEIDDLIARKEKERHRATTLSLASRTSHSELPTRKEKANKNRPESKKRSKTVQPQKSFGNRLTRSDKQGIRDSFELWVNELIEEGYDLSEYTWDEMYDIYEAEGSYGQTPKARQAMGQLAIARRSKPASEYSQKGEKTKKVKEIEKHTRRIDNGPDVGNRGKKSTKPRHSGFLGKSGRGKLDQDSRDYARDSAVEYTAGGHKPGPGTVTKNPKKLRKQKAMGEIGEQFDIFDVVLEFLQVEGYAETLEEAEWMMANLIDEEAIAIITELTGGKGHPGYKAGSKDHGPMQSGHPADTFKRTMKGGTMSQRHGDHLGDLDDDDDDDDGLEAGLKDSARKRRENVRKPLRDKVKAARKVLSKEDYVNEAITSEKGKAKAAEMIANRTTASGRAKSGQGANVAMIKHIGRSNRDGLLGTPPNRKVAGRNWPKSYTGIGGTGNKAARRAAELNKEAFEAWLDEAMTNYEKNRKRAAQRAAARNAARDAGKTGAVPGVGYVTPRREKETWTDERGKTRHAKGL